MPCVPRRAFLWRALALAGGTALVPALAGCGGGGGGRWAGRSLVVVTDGGAARLALWGAAFVPFARDTGCRVMEIDTEDRDAVAELRRQALVGQPQWDVVALDATRVPALAAEGFLEPLDDPALRRADLRPGFAPERAIGVLGDTLALACRAEPFDGRVPGSWAEVWDTGAFPGPRAAPRDGVGLLEVALLADGVSPDRLYPLDLERAFRALDRLRPAVSLWWRKTDRSRLAVEEGLVDLALARGGELRQALASGADARIPPLPVPILPVCWGVPRGAPNGDIAWDFIAYTLRPDVQDALAEQGFLPALASRGPAVPANAFPPDLGWWAANGRAATEHFADWVRR